MKGLMEEYKRIRKLRNESSIANNLTQTAQLNKELSIIYQEMCEKDRADKA
jgi:hypothetical protein